MSDGSLIPRFRRARRDETLAVLEGFHALKHALRFDAPLLEVVAADDAALERLAAALAPDLSARLLALAHPVEPAVFAQLAPLHPPTGVIALAERRPGDPVASSCRLRKPEPTVKLVNRPSIPPLSRRKPSAW